MFRPRIIPVLLLRNKGLVKSVRFQDHRYIGDPVNAVKIFNDLKADELVFLDIEAAKQRRCISGDFVKMVGEEANMPFSCGGGITTLRQIQDILSAGAEKVVINTQAITIPDFVKDAGEEFGSTSIVVCIDYKKDLLGRYRVYGFGGAKKSSYSPSDFAKLMETQGAGELILQSVEHDGHMNGYDLEMLKTVTDHVSVPVVALGGAGNTDHLADAVKMAGCNAVAAGSLFVYHGNRKGVLINYPDPGMKRKLFV